MKIVTKDRNLQGRQNMKYIYVLYIFLLTSEEKQYLNYILVNLAEHTHTYPPQKMPI
jgi:hypothetical protein